MTSSDVTDMFRVLYRFITLQSYNDYTESPSLNTTAEISWTSFEMYQTLAEQEWTQLLVSRSIPETSISEDQTYAAYCHLIADYFEQGNPDWNYRSQSQAPGVNFSRGDDTAPRAALKKLLASIETAYKMSIISGGRGSAMTPGRITDAKNYPKRWKRSGIPAYDPDGVDSGEVDDAGVDYNDNNNSTGPWY
jgi:hypothetical protein